MIFCLFCNDCPFLQQILKFDKVAKFDYGMKENNPVNQYLFYSKDYKEKPEENPRKMISDEVSHMLPQNFLVRSCL